MIPKTKLQKRVAALSSKLPPITEVQIQYAYDNCFEHNGYMNKGFISCLDCGNQWEDKQPPLLTSIDGCICPNCGMKLKVTHTKKKKDKQGAYYGVITTCGEFQVIRFIDVMAYYETGQKPHYASNEIVQYWILPNGEYETMAKLRSQFFSCYGDSWSWASPMEIRPKTNTTCYSLIPPKIYPNMKLLPELKRNGFKGGFHGLAPFRMFYLLLTDSKAETLLKAKQYGLLKYYTEHSYSVNNYWPLIKICIRNKYKVKDASMWKDYLDLLNHFGKDLHNAKYVCPKDLRKAHDRYVRKQRGVDEREELNEKRRKVKEQEKEFRELKKQFFGISFSEGNITVKVLTTVKAHLKEGDVLHHCVFSNSYHLKPESLILSATVDGKKMETVEVSLKSFTVQQCRGKFNNNTAYHKRIINLVNKNMHLIKERLKPKKNGTKKDVTAAA